MATQNALNNVEIDKAIVNAKGDLIVGSADDTPAILGVGNTGDVLVVASGTAAWAPPAAQTDTKVKYDVNDAATGYLSEKVVAGTGITLAEGTGGDADKLKITCSVADTDTLVKYAADDAAAGTLSTKIVAGTGISLAEGTAGDADKLVITNTVADTDKFAKVSADDTTPGYLNGKLTAGTGITLTEGTPAGNETLGISVAAALPGGGINWSVVTGDTTLVANNGYLTNKATAIAFTLPAAAAVGSIIRIAGGLLAGGWSIVQAANMMVHFGTVSTTTGVGGSLASTDHKDVIELVCTVANLEWQVLSAVGNITVV